ncbi:Fic family protein [Candidatus Woesearchaeota archaeon]|nr:Fic family protein [Candidatus Woesearchaeota archaeon]
MRDEGGLYHSVSKVLSKIDKGTRLLDVAAIAYHDFATRHHFNDGNKRFSHVFAKMLLFNDGFHLTSSYPQALPIIVKIASGQLSHAQICEWLEPNITELGRRPVAEFFEKIEEDLRK